MKPHQEPISRRTFLQGTLAYGGIAAAFAPRLVRAAEEAVPRRSRISYYHNGEIHVNEIGQPEGKPLTNGHWDFKPSWSKTGDMLVFFRRLKNDPDVGKWITAVHITASALS